VKSNTKISNHWNLNKSVNSTNISGNIGLNVGGTIAYSLPSGWATYSNNGSYCSIQYLSGTNSTAKVQINFLNTTNVNNQVSLWNPLSGAWQNLAGTSFGLQQAVTGAYTIGNMIPSLTYTIRAKTYESGAWRECVLYIKADDNLMPTGGSEMAYSDMWNYPNTPQYENSNCYNYALGFFTNQPGGVSPGGFANMGDWTYTDINPTQWTKRVEADMKVMFNNSNISQYWKLISNTDIPGYNGYRVAGYIHNGYGNDNFYAFHFYRQDAYGNWSHKLPHAPSMNGEYSNTNIKISNPALSGKLVGTVTYETPTEPTNYNYFFAFYNLTW